VNHFGELSNFIWNVADLLRGPYKPHEYGRVILPMTVLRRLDCVLEPTKQKVLQTAKKTKLEPLLAAAAGQGFYNTSKYDFDRLLGDPAGVASNLTHYMQGFSPKARDILDRFKFEGEIARLEESNLLFQVVKKFAAIDLHPERVSNRDMGYVFEDLIRRFSEARNETAGDHFTPREVIRLMVNLLFTPDGDALQRRGVVRTLLDPAAGTGGMLSVAEEYLHELNPDARLIAFGQDWNDESYAICGSDMLIKGQSIDRIVFGSSFSKDGFQGKTFDYLLANPPFGVKWEADQDHIVDEYETLGSDGRFGAGLPRINDGSFLFLQHMISKMKPPKEGGSRIGIVFNASPLFTGDAGSGESEIRRWIIENDWLEAIVALPDQLFYNTGIYTYVWIVTNRKKRERRGKIQLINGVDFFVKMRKSLGNKRNEIGDGRDDKPDQIGEITKVYGAFEDGEHSKIFRNEDFGFRKITVERPLRLSFQASPERIEALGQERVFENLTGSKKKEGSKAAIAEIEAGRELQEAIIQALGTLDSRKVYKNRDAFEKDLQKTLAKANVKVPGPVKKAILAALGERDETAEVCRDADGNPEPDAELRDYENVPLTEDIHEYFQREVEPHVPEAWIDEGKTKKGFEIPFTRHFYKYVPPRPLEEIEADIAELEKEIVGMLREVVG
jgi:type I restriction enzyme M protein